MQRCYLYLKKIRKNLLAHETFCNNSNLTYLYFLNSKGAGFPFEKMVIFTVLTLLMLAGVGMAQNGNYLIQKHSFADVLQNKRLLEFLNKHRKTPVLESEDL